MRPLLYSDIQDSKEANDFKRTCVQEFTYATFSAQRNTSNKLIIKFDKQEPCEGLEENQT